jgi:hypothetical protein
MAARASILNDIGDNAPANWEHPFGTSAPDFSDGLCVQFPAIRRDNIVHKLGHTKASHCNNCSAAFLRSPVNTSQPAGEDRP